MMFTLENFYQSREWTRLKTGLMLERMDADGILRCARCGEPIVARYDCIGHHVIELTDANVTDAAVSLNPDNIELVHFRRHNAIHERFGTYQRRVFLVYGAPCAGKSTWVRANASADDLILDIDALWEAVCVSDRYHKPPRLAQNVFGLRDCMIDQIRVRAGKWRRAFVVGGYPLRSERDRMCGMLGAEPVFIDTDKADCLARAENDKWRGYISDWFDAYSE